MAKGTRSGLGRGLGSLMSGSYDEAMAAIAQEAPVSERVLVEVDEEELPKEARRSSQPGRSTKDREKTTEEPKRAEMLEAVPQVASAAPADAEAPARDAEGMTTPPSIAEAKAETQAKDPDSALEELPISNIEPNPDQPRSNFNKDELKELADSIAREGVIQPILVRLIEGQTYQIVAGERRWQASKIAGLETVPVRIIEADDDKAIELALVENVQRSDLNPIEEAYGYKRIMDRQGVTQAALAAMVGKGRSTIANTLRLLDLPEIAQELLYEGKITEGHARAILSVPTKEGKERLTAKILQDKLTVRAAEQLARLYSGTGEAKEPKEKAPKPSSYKAVAKTLKAMLAAPVKVKSAGGKNKVEIEFKDEEDLERIFRLITNK